MARGRGTGSRDLGGEQSSVIVRPPAAGYALAVSRRNTVSENHTPPTSATQPSVGETLFELHDPTETAALDRLRSAWKDSTEPERAQFLDGLKREFLSKRRSQVQPVTRYGNPRRARRRS